MVARSSAVLWGSLACAVLMVLLPRTALPESAQEESFPFIEEMLESGYFGESDAEKAHALYGQKPVSYLLTEFDAADEDPVRRGDVVFILGRFGVTEIVPDAIDFVNTELTKETTELTKEAADKKFRGLSMALFGLGYLGTDESLNFLVKVAEDESWVAPEDDKGDVAKYRANDERAKRRIQSSAIQALGGAGSERAIGLLNELSDKVDGQAAAIVSAKKDARDRLKNRPPTGVAANTTP